MPTLKHLIEELRRLSVRPDELHIPGQLYDDLLDQGEDIAEEDDDDSRESHRDKAEFHKTMLQSLQSEYHKYETRVEKMYEDKLDGNISESL